ncbi:hypothetical protein PR202_ga15799 [Eleusine coracana subsp. coracana]|uniref:WAT1-related protein n=1 Tax=Eleusine coracana subsp. coracana TaxID=191504 RepID=A0AAV5CL62_ELECO|nr:hypothetical protein PR202_ga15799 [Eleusine coracana subsp. coracana]
MGVSNLVHVIFPGLPLQSIVMLGVIQIVVIVQGVAGSGVTFYLQSWCISVRGPLYSAMFNPFCIVLAAVVLGEELHVGSLLGAIGVISGLYVVLWGKAGDSKVGRASERSQDMEKTAKESDLKLDVGNSIAEPLLGDGSPTAASAMEDYTPPAAMMLTQCIYATVALWAKAVFTGGMSPMVFVVYRQAVATVVLVPIVIVVNRKKMKQILNPGISGFSLVFVASLVGATLNLCLYYQGVHLGSSSMATAMANLIPAITFVMAASVGLETVDVRKPRSLAKIFGTIVWRWRSHDHGIC